MNFLESYYYNIITYDFYNKFNYDEVKHLPKLKKIILNFSLKTTSFETLLTFLIILELISFNGGTFTCSKLSNINFKIQKGNPVGCKVILRKASMYSFLSKFCLSILPNLKQFDGLFFSLKSFKSITFKFKKLMLFSELLNQYETFKKIPPMSLTFVVDSSKNIQELLYLFRSYKLPLTQGN